MENFVLSACKDMKIFVTFRGHNLRINFLLIYGIQCKPEFTYRIGLFIWKGNAKLEDLIKSHISLLEIT